MEGSESIHVFIYDFLLKTFLKFAFYNANYNYNDLKFNSVKKLQYIDLVIKIFYSIYLYKSRGMRSVRF